MLGNPEYPTNEETAIHNIMKEPNIRTQIHALLSHLNKGLYEREDAIRLALLSACAGESLFLLGRPGVAKSMVARRLKHAFREGRSFEYLMNRFSTPEDIFGPISIQKLTQEDTYERLTEHYLPGAEVVFLDEIWKAGPSIQNTLLTLINEKVFRNGAQEIDVPLRGLVAASNELPEAGMGLEALWDRFLVRLLVEGVEDRHHFRELISAPEDPFTPPKEKDQITEDQYQDWQQQIGQVSIPEEVYLLIELIRQKVTEHAQAQSDPTKALYVSDRRWRKIVRLMRTAAFLNGREVVDLMDGFLIAHCIWDEPDQISLVAGWVEESIRSHGYRLTLDLETVKGEIKRLKEDVEKETTVIRDEEYHELFTKKHDNKLHVIFTTGGESYWLEKAAFDKLKLKESTDLSCERLKPSRNHYNNTSWFSLKKSKEEFRLIYDGVEVPLETRLKTRRVTTTRPPHSAVVRDWDKQVKTILTRCETARGQIERYKENELSQLRLNLFVPVDRAEIVEDHLEHTLQDIADLEVDVKEVQHQYMELKEAAPKKSSPAKLKSAES